MIKLNLHAHTNYSDGKNTLEDMVLAYKRNGFLCAVVTDHVYSTNYKLSLTENTYQYQIYKATKLIGELNYPIICGLEISCRELGEEIILLGDKACVEFMHQRSKLLTYKNQIVDNYQILKDIKNKYKSYTILAHPFLNNIDDLDRMGRIVDVIDGFEVINAGQFQFLNRSIPVELNDKARYCNSDAHSVKQLLRCCNTLTKDYAIKNDSDLIDTLRDYDNRYFQFLN